ncbi:MAG TPA: sigma-70 family RNA polymerase sigma factor [Candidatus Dormibacteraeota bacterium]|nr:sigma-70 family RNA polymerase sigma factor [Candidatus Dormibacteraeota bacterium]
MPDPSDLDLVARANRGEVEAFEALYRRYRDWVVALAERHTGNRDDALDVLQDAFAYLFGRFPGFVLSAQMKTFLYPVVRNLSLDRVRRRRPEVDVDTLADILPAPPVTVAGDLGRLLAAMPAAQREVLLLRYADDLSLAQIAEALAIPLGTVKSRLHVALGALKARTQRRA